MKGFNIRKLATIAAGAALIGSAVAPIAAAALTDLTKSDVIDATGAPVVDIVVGSHAAVSDVVWAGNIAAKLAQLATKTTAVTGGSGTGTATVDSISVKIAVGGTTTVTGGKTFFSDMNSAALASSEANFTDQNVTESNIPSLKYYGSKTYTWNNSSYSTTMQEKLNFSSQAMYDSVSKKKLVATILQGKLQYLVDLGSGVPAVEAAGSGASFVDDKNDNVLIPFFGKDYLVKTVTPTGTKYVELVETNGEKDYKDGDKIEGLKDSNGNSYYVKVGPGGVDGTTNKIKLEVFDSTDTKLDGGYYSSGDVTFYNNGQTFLSTSVNVSAILKSTVSSSEVYVATIYLGTSRIQLYDGKGYPYLASQAADTYDYTTTLSLSSDNNYLTKISIANSSNKVWNGTTALELGASVDYPNSVGSLKVVGLQLPGFSTSKTERTTVVEIGGGVLKYKDKTYEANHEIPFTIPSLGNMIDLGTAGNASFTMDGKPFWMKIARGDVNVWASDATGAQVSVPSPTQCIGDGNYINGVIVNVKAAPGNTNAVIGGTTLNVGNTVDLNGMQFRYTGYVSAKNCVYLTADGNISIKKDSSTGTLVQEVYYVDKNVAKTAEIALPGASDVTAGFVPLVYEVGAANTRVWLLLSDQNFGGTTALTQYSKRVQLVGTDMYENGVWTGTTSAVSFPYFVPSSVYLPSDYNGGSSYNTNNYHVAVFQIDEGLSAFDFNAFVDAGTGNLITLPNSQLSFYGEEVDYQNLGLVNSSNATWKMSANTAQIYPTDAYSDYGTHATLASGVVKFVLPENRPQFELLLSGTGTTTTTTGGEELDIAKGATGSTTAGTTIEVKDVTYTATCGAGTGACTPESYEAVVPIGKLVYTDDSPPTGKVIIVGGHLVNALAKGITDDKLAAAGDKVAEKEANGDIVVAGYTASDTGAAAQELIDALDALR